MTFEEELQGKLGAMPCAPRPGGDRYDEGRKAGFEEGARWAEQGTPVTRLIEVEEPFIGPVTVVECCKRGPVTDENYCAWCGRKIIR